LKWGKEYSLETLKFTRRNQISQSVNQSLLRQKAEQRHIQETIKARKIEPEAYSCLSLRRPMVLRTANV